MDEHLYVVAYDISDQKRWRRVFKLMKGYGDWLQLSVFQCRLSKKRHAELVALLDGIIHHGEDHVILVNVGPAERTSPKVTSLGKEFEPLARDPTIV